MLARYAKYLFIILLANFASSDVDDFCLINDSSYALGVCRKIMDCPSAIEDVKNGIHPISCGFDIDKRTPVVCCQLNSPILPTTSGVPTSSRATSNVVTTTASTQKVSSLSTLLSSTRRSSTTTPFLEETTRPDVTSTSYSTIRTTSTPRDVKSTISTPKPTPTITTTSFPEELNEPTKPFIIRTKLTTRLGVLTFPPTRPSYSTIRTTRNIMTSKSTTSLNDVTLFTFPPTSPTYSTIRTTTRPNIMTNKLTTRLNALTFPTTRPTYSIKSTLNSMTNKLTTRLNALTFPPTRPTYSTTIRTPPNTMTNKLTTNSNDDTYPPTRPTYTTIRTTRRPNTVTNKLTTRLNDVTYLSTTVRKENLPPIHRLVEIDKSKQKCQEYSELLRLKNSPAAIQNCVSSVREYVGGLRAAPKEFPHMARVGYLDPNNGISWLCDGSLISEKFVLTSAKCLTSRPHGKPTKVMLGDHASGDNTTFQEFYVVNHYVYHNFTAMTLYNDIALLELDRNANFNTNVRPACLNTKFNVPKLLAVTGWENDLHFQNNSLLKIPIHKVSHSECTTAYATLGAKVLRHGIMDETQICARFKNGRLNTLDSGAPLQVLNADRCTFKILGVTSVSSGSDKPHIHTRVSAYVKWIEDIVWPD